MKNLLVIVLLLLAGLPASPLFAQKVRPIPYPVMPPPAFERAISEGTRTTTGAPGAAYWTNTAEYTIQATLSPATKELRGQETIRYHNNAPDSLHRIVVHLRQNLHREGVVRNRPQQLTGGIQMAVVAVEGQPMLERTRPREAGYTIDGTLMTIVLPEPLAPGASTTLSFAWRFAVPEAGAPRMGQDGEVFFLGYWYPQVAVYDDVNGWTADPYQGNGEFYMDYSDYDVRITVPEGWLVAATGTLQNPDEVLTSQTRDRLARAAASGDVVAIVTADEREAGRSTARSRTGLTWHFTAQQVRDFAFGTSDRYVWDAASADTGAGSTLIHALYRPDREVWQRSAEFGKFTIEFLSEYLLPYPYPHMTAVEGIIGGGMEYPMITLIGGSRTPRSLFGVTFHEMAHMWFPMIVGQNEKRYTWMDEGLTSFNTNEGEAVFFDTDAWNPSEQSYYYIAGTGNEVESMRHGDQYPYGTSARGIASYSKPAVTLHALRGIVGQERFEEAYRAYAERWAFKHPTPYDLFNTFEDVLGEDLDWFWTPMFFETWTLDQAVGAVEPGADAVTVTIEDRGLTPMPAPVRVTYADGTVKEQTVPVDVWLDDRRAATLRFEPGTVTRVEIDPEAYLPDVDRANNVWEGR